jgi:mono/diheme cytochrome c family protein
MRKFSTAFSAAMMVGGLLSACGAKPAASAAAPAASAGGEPSIVIADQAEWDSLLAAGKSSFDTACGACHPGGEADLGPALKGERESIDEMTTQIRQGSGRMKPVGEDRLPESDMKGLFVYLASLDAVTGVKGP